MQTSIMKKSIFLKFLICIFVLLVAFTQADFIFPKLEFFIFFLTMVGFLFSKPRKSIVYNFCFFSIILVFLWRISSYFRSPFFGDISALSIPLATTSAIIFCFIVVPTVFKGFNDFIPFYKNLLIVVLIVMFLLNFVFPESYDSAGADKGVSLAFLHPNVLGLYALSLIYLCVFDILLSKRYFLNIIIIITSLYLLFLTNSRGAYIVVSISFVVYFVYFVFRNKKLRFIFINRWSAASCILVCFYYLKKAYDYYGYDYFNILSSGRLYILDIAISDVGDNYLWGMGILPRAFMYGFDSQRLGAGLDGVYSVVFYNEGLIGLGLLIISHLFFVRLGLKSNYFLIKFIFFTFMIGVLVHAVYEAHYWQRVSPPTFMMFSMVSLLLKNQKINIK